MLVNLKVVNFFWNPCIGANQPKRKLYKFYKIALLVVRGTMFSFEIPSPKQIVMSEKTVSHSNA